MAHPQGLAPYDLIVVDVDGTLLDDERAVTAEVHQVVTMAERAGVRLTLATGRVFCSAAQVARQLEMAGPIISDGGAIVALSCGSKVLRDLRIPPKRAAEILRELADIDADCHLFYPDEILVNRHNHVTRRYASRLAITMVPSDDLAAEALARPVGPTMIVIRSTRQRAPALRAKYQRQFGDDIQVTSTAPHFVDFVHPQTSKAGALAFLCDYLGIPAERVIAIGDGINDLDMIAWAGLGVLVANADPELHRHADYVTSSPYYHGVAEVIERFCQK